MRADHADIRVCFGRLQLTPGDWVDGVAGQRINRTIDLKHIGGRDFALRVDAADRLQILLSPLYRPARIIILPGAIGAILLAMQFDFGQHHKFAVLGGGGAPAVFQRGVIFCVGDTAPL